MCGNACAFRDSERSQHDRLTGSVDRTIRFMIVRTRSPGAVGPPSCGCAICPWVGATATSSTSSPPTRRAVSDPIEQDTLAWALNERLDEVAAAAHVPYLTVGEPTSESLQEVISDLLDDGWHAPRSPHPETE